MSIKKNLVEFGGFMDADAAETLSSTWFPIIRLMERLEHGFRMTAKWVEGRFAFL